MPHIPPDDGTAGKSRRRRRVTWTPDGHVGDDTDTVPESDAPHTWGDADDVGQDQSNDERLTSDKPPHWA